MVVTKEKAIKAIKSEFEGCIIIGGYEYNDYYGFEVAPPDWKEGDMLGDEEVFVNKNSGEIEYLSPTKYIKMLKTGKKII